MKSQLIPNNEKESTEKLSVASIIMSIFLLTALFDVVLGLMKTRSLELAVKLKTLGTQTNRSRKHKTVESVE